MLIKNGLLARFLRLSISKQVLAILLIGVLVQVSVLQLFMREHLVSTHITNKVDKIRENFVLALDATENLLLDGRLDEVGKLLAILNTSIDVRVALVTDDSGAVVITSDSKYRNGNIQKIIDDFELEQFDDILIHPDQHSDALIQRVCDKGEKLLFVAPVQFSRLKSPDAHTHDLVLLADLQQTRELALWSSYYAFFIQITAMLGISLLLLLVFNQGVQARLIQVIRELKGVADGDVDCPIILDGENEITQISREANGLIAQLKHSRNQVLRQKEYFQSVFEKMAHAAIIVDDQGNIVVINHTASKYLKDKQDLHHGFSELFPLSIEQSTDLLFEPATQCEDASFKSFLLLDEQWLRVDVKVTNLSALSEPKGQKIIIIADEQIQYELQTRIIEDEHTLSSIIENIPGLVFVFEKQSHMQFINEKARQFFQLEHRQYQFHEFLTLIPQELQHHLEKRFPNLAMGDVYKNESVCFVLDDKEYFYTVTLFPVSVQATDKSFVACIMSDNTKEVLNERKLIASQAHLKEFASYAPFAIVEWSYLFEITYWNAAAEKLFEISAEEAIGASLPKLIASNSNIELLASHLDRARNGNCSYTRNISYEHGKSTLKHTEWTSFSIPAESLAEPRYVSMIVDVTQMTAMIQDLILKEAEKDELLQSMVEAVITIDQTGKILTFNQAAENIFGYSFEEIKGQNVNKLMPQDVAVKHDGFLSRHAVTGERKILGFGRELIGQKKGGDQFPMYLSVNELPKQQGSLRRFIGSCMDLSDIKDKEKQLSRSLKMDALGKLTGGIAHDFNNLLGIVMGYCELIMMDDSLAERHKESLLEVRKAGHRATALTSKLLNFSKKKANQISPLNLSDAIQENQMILEKSLRPGISLRFELATDLKNTNVDSGDFEDALLNLVINSVQAIKFSGEICVKTYNCTKANAKECDCFKECIMCEVIDDGPGIPEEYVDKVFDPFFSSKGEKGTGLGLSQVYGFVKRSGGQINVTSSEAGTKMQIVLPVYRGESTKPESGNSNKSLQNQYSGRILVVDDEENLTEIVQLILERVGFSVETTNFPTEALSKLSEGQYDLLLTDVVMPELDGIRLASKARELAPDMKILMMSGYMDYETSSDLEDEMRRKLIKKPFSPSDIIDAVVSELE